MKSDMLSGFIVSISHTGTPPASVEPRDGKPAAPSPRFSVTRLPNGTVGPGNTARPEPGNRHQTGDSCPQLGTNRIAQARVSHSSRVAAGNDAGQKQIFTIARDPHGLY